jgi:S-formylglutathione hydrolase
MTATRNFRFVLALAVLTLGGVPAAASELVEGEVSSDLVPAPVPYYAVLPPGYAEATEPFPLVLNLHGGNGDRNGIKRQVPSYDEMWASGELPPMVIVMASVTKRGFYMDFADGSERWESFIIGPYLEHLRATFKVSKDPKKTFITGISMGGMGSLRIAFKHPELFGAVAGLEPGISPILRWEEMRLKHRFWRADDLFERAYGKPVDPEYWAANNPASIVAANPQRLRDSGLQIYVDAGDDDEFWLYEGAEFLHQVLWDRRVKHEYHLVRGAGHVGPSHTQRVNEAFKFLARSMDPWDRGNLPAAVRRNTANIKKLAAAVEEGDHYSQVDAEPRITAGW